MQDIKQEDYVKFFQKKLYDNPAVLEYLKKERKLKESTIEELEIGYCPPSVGYPKKGYFSYKGKLGFLRGRIIFPIRDEFGHIIAFSGRKYEKDSEEIAYYFRKEFGDVAEQMIERWERGKWINDVYDKKFNLYHLYHCKHILPILKTVCVTEGQLDVAGFLNHGVQSVVALCGTSMSKWQMYALLRYGVKKVIICLDGDEAGKKGAKEIVNKLRQYSSDFKVFAVILDGTDPDAFLLTKNAKSLIDYIDNVIKDEVKDRVVFLQ